MTSKTPNRSTGQRRSTWHQLCRLLPADTMDRCAVVQWLHSALAGSCDAVDAQQAVDLGAGQPEFDGHGATGHAGCSHGAEGAEVVGVEHLDRPHKFDGPSKGDAGEILASGWEGLCKGSDATDKFSLYRKQTTYVQPCRKVNLANATTKVPYRIAIQFHGAAVGHHGFTNLDNAVFQFCHVHAIALYILKCSKTPVGFATALHSGHRLVYGLARLAQDGPIHIGAQLFALDACKGLNVRALFGWNLVLFPLVDNRVAGQGECARQPGHSTGNVDGLL